MTDSVKNNPQSDGNDCCVKPCCAWRRRLLVASLAILVFLSGAVVGGVSAGYVMMHRFHLRPRHPDQIPKRIVHHMRRKFNLSDDQASQIQTIMTRKVDAMCEIHRDMYPRIESEMNALFRGPASHERESLFDQFRQAEALPLGFPRTSVFQKCSERPLHTSNFVFDNVQVFAGNAPLFKFLTVSLDEKFDRREGVS